MVQITRGVILALVMLNPGAEAEIRAEQKVVAASGGWVKIPSTADGAATAFFVVDNPTMYDVVRGVSGDGCGGCRGVSRAGGEGSTSTRVVKEITAPAYGKVEQVRP